VTKFDAWANLLGVGRLELGRILKTSRATGETALDLPRVEELSTRVRALLSQYSPEIVSAAEAFARQVLFVPVSALGCSPELDINTGMLGVRPRNIAPMWAEVPLLYALCRWMKGLIPYVVPKTPDQRSELRADDAAPFPRVWGETGT